jgi:hypothetical protein
MNYGNAACAMWVRVGDSWSAMGRPSGVADPGAPGQRFMDQQIRQVHLFAHGPAPIKITVVDGCNAGAVIAAVF